MRRVLPLIVLLLSFHFINAQTLQTFDSAPVLTGQFPTVPQWKNVATVAIDGVEYVLTAGGNGTWTHLSSGGASNTATIRKDGSGGDQLSIARKDGEPFRFYGIWIKHSSMLMLPYYKPPYYTITYNKTVGPPDVYTYENTAVSSEATYEKDLVVTSVSLYFTSMMYYWIDNLKVGPAVAAAPPLSATTWQTNLACNGFADGNATVNVIGGTSPYTYLWSPSGGTNATAKGLSAGAYSCLITDAAGQTLTKNLTISQPPSLHAVGMATNVTCNGGSNGTATVTASGGSFPYSYSWSPSGGTGATATGLAAGAYTCTITDANNCSVQKQVIVTQPPAKIITISSQPQNTTASAGAAASFSVEATNVETYLWQENSGAGFTNIQENANYKNATTPTLTISSVTTTLDQYQYRCLMTTACGATKYSNSVSLSVLSNNAFLSGISIGGATLSPAFTAANGQYKSSVAAGVDYLDITPSAQYPYASVSIDGYGVNGGTSARIPLEAGLNTIIITVTAQDGITIKQYTLVVYRPYVGVSSVNQTDGPLTNKSTATFIVTFDSKLDGLTAGNLQLTSTGSIKDYAVETVTQTAPNVYTVAVNTGSGDGSLALSIANDNELSSSLAGLPISITEGIVVDKTAPVVKAKSTQVKLGTSGSVTIYSEELNDGTTDNQSDPSRLEFKLDKNTFTAADLGFQTVMITATDEAGNSATTSTEITVIKEIVDIQELLNASIMYGQTPALPDSVMVTYIDESQAKHGISWDLSHYNRNAGTHKIIGAIKPEPFTFSEYPLHAVQVLTINTRPLQVSLKDSIVKEYDGDSHVAETDIHFETDKLEGDQVTVTAQAFFDDKHVGTGKTVTADHLQLAGEQAGNYHLASNTVTGDIGRISPRTLEVWLTGTVEKIYDGSLVASVTSEHFHDNRIKGDDLTISALALYDDKQAGTGKMVTTRNLAIAGEDANNYRLASEEASANIGSILVKPIDVAFSLEPMITKVYDGSATAMPGVANYELRDIVEGDDIVATGIANYPDAEVGTGKTILVEDIQLSGEDANNYLLTSTTTTMVGNITPKAITVNIAGDKSVSKVYDGTTLALIPEEDYVLEGLMDGDHVSALGIAYYDNRHAGTQKMVMVREIMLLGKDASDYVLENQETSTVGTIIPKPVTLALNTEPVIKVYDGTVAATISRDNFIIGGVLEGDEVFATGNASYTQKNVGAQIPVEVVSLQLNGSDHKNYTHDYDRLSALNGKITPASLTIIAEDKIKTQGQPNPGFTFRFEGLAAGDAFTMLTEPATATTDAVSRSPIGVFTIVPSGAASANYRIHYVSGKLTVVPKAGNADNNLKAWSSAPGVLQVTVYSDKDQKAAVVLYTEAGQPLVMQQKQLQKGMNSFPMQTGHLSSSTYILRVTTNSFNAGQRIPIK